MEILGYLRARLRTVAVLVLLPIIAALAAFSIVKERPSQYVGSVQVTVPSGSDNSAGQITIFRSNYQLAVRSPDVASTVAGQLGVRPGGLPARLKVGRIAQSSTLSVTYETSDADRAREGARLAAAAGLTQLSELELTRRQVELKRVQDEFDAAQASVQKVQNATGLLFPDEEYGDIRRRVRDLQASIVRAKAQGRPEALPELQAQLTALTARQNSLVSSVRDYRTLQARAADAEDRLVATQASLDRLRASGSPSFVAAQLADPLVARSSSNSRLVQAVIGAAAVAFLLAFVVLVGPDLLRSRRGTAPTGAAAASGDDGAANEQRSPSWQPQNPPRPTSSTALPARGLLGGDGRAPASTPGANG